MRNRYFIGGTLLVLALGVVFTLWIRSDQNKFHGPIKSGERFIWYEFSVGDKDAFTYTLHDNEVFPAPGSEAFSRLQVTMDQNQAYGRFTVSSNQKVLTGYRDHRMAGEQGWVFNARVHSALGQYFGGRMRRSMATGAFYRGPWEISRDDQTFGQSAEIDNVGNFMVRLWEEENVNGQKYLMVWASQWPEGKYEQKIRQQFRIWLDHGQPVIEDLKWVLPGPCGSYTLSREQPDIWNGQVSEYLPYLLEFPNFAKYLNSGEVSRVLGVKAIEPLAAHWKPERFGACA